MIESQILYELTKWVMCKACENKIKIKGKIENKYI